jgi:regulator of protease activity HflC (stomatin/prohibitin superfamily)
MFGIKKVQIHSWEKGILTKRSEPSAILSEGLHTITAPILRESVTILSMKDIWIKHPQLDVLIKKGLLDNVATVLDIGDGQRALVWVDGRFAGIFGPGLHAYWNGFNEVEAEVIDTKDVYFTHEKLQHIMQTKFEYKSLKTETVSDGHVGILYQDDVFQEVLNPGKFVFWTDSVGVRVVQLDMRDKQLDVAGQEIMTQDKVTLRLNAVVSYKISNPQKAVQKNAQPDQALYRDAQLLLREIVGTHDLDTLLADKQILSDRFKDGLVNKATELGLEVLNVGIRDIILPGDIRDLLNQVTEAKKAAEANLIARREETAAMRSQVNTAKLLENNPVLMRLKEMEALLKVAETSKLNIIMSEKGLTDRLGQLI